MIFLKRRIETLRAKLTARDLDALVLIDTEKCGWENVFYYSGFQGTSAVVVVTHDREILATDPRYLTQAEQQSPFEIRPVRAGQSQVDIVKSLTEELKLKHCGIDGAKLCTETFFGIAKLPVEWFNFSDDMACQRRSKDSHEVALIAKAADIATAAYLDTLKEVRIGMKEIEFAKLLELNIARHDGEGVWHNNAMIVASGVRSAMPHGVAGSREMKLGDQVTVDYGAIYGGYMSDLTRNFSLGAVKDPEFLDIHEILLKAHKDSAAVLRPGIRGCDVHAVAQKVIDDAGYGKYFGHGLGHSLGLEIHEDPRLSPLYTEELKVGDVVTIEPGIYIPERGGLRLEDDYLITEQGASRLSPRLPQEFVHLDL
ncbi:MAG: aminopeptidase P family protein [Pyramidobacter sp.]|nr:aminopeptidase P family protein [Pyramidobacter sp.]